MAYSPEQAAEIKAVQIYGLSDPATGNLRYVGKANDASARLKSHLRDCKRRNTPVYCWMRKLIAKGELPVLSILTECSQHDWREREQEAIASARASGASLLNLAKGGDEPFCDRSVRQANGRAVAKLRVATPERARVYYLKRQIGQLLAEGRVSETSKAKLRIAAQKRPDLFGVWATI